MSRLQVRNSPQDILEVQIVPDRASKWFWLAWAIAGVVILAVGWYQLPQPSLRSLPIWMILLIVTAIVFVKGWQGWVWESRGWEKLRVGSGELAYEREGSVLDRKLVRIPCGEVSEVVVLSFGLGDSFEPNRLQVKAKRRSLYLGRGLSKPQGLELSELLSSALAQHARPTRH